MASFEFRSISGLAADRGEQTVHLSAAIAASSSLYLLWHCCTIRRKTLLTKQVMNIAVANFFCFFSVAVLPWTPELCDLRTNAFNVFLDVSLVFEALVALGTLAVVYKWQRFATRLERLQPAVWPCTLATTLPLWLGRTQSDPEHYGLCVESRVQAVMHMSCGFPIWILICLTYLCIILRARTQSPCSVKDAHIRCFKAFFAVWCICLGTYGTEFLYFQFVDAGESRAAYIFGQMFICLHGLCTALTFRFQRLRVTDVFVCFEESDEVVVLEAGSSKVDPSFRSCSSKLSG